jgi:hypothetical protein
MAYIYVQISRIDGRIRELEDECYRLVSEGHGSTLVIRFRIEKMEALRAKLISRYLQQQKDDDGSDGDGGGAPPSPPAAGGAAAVN